MRALIVFVVVGASAALLAQTPQNLPGSGLPPLDPRIDKWDRGPDKIDVSKYPPEVKQKYKVFADLCGQCHPLARAVNCDFVLDEDWERYIKRMMRRGKGLVTPETARQSYEFAIYDSKIRKKDLYEQRLKDQAAKP